jgi:hypothetical protein
MGDRKFNRTGGWYRVDVTIAGRLVASAAREATGRDGDGVATSEGAEREWGMVCLGMGAGRSASLGGGHDGRGLPLRFLVEDRLG